MFTPYGNHGLGDNARIPISISKEISNINWTENGRLRDVKSVENQDIDLTKFKIADNFLCGNLNSDFYTYRNKYFIYDINSESIQEFETSIEYNSFARKNGLPNTNEFKSFKENYDDYWSGWRLFFLP